MYKFPSIIKIKSQQLLDLSKKEHARTVGMQHPEQQHGRSDAGIHGLAHLRFITGYARDEFAEQETNTSATAPFSINTLCNDYDLMVLIRTILSCPFRVPEIRVAPSYDGEHGHAKRLATESLRPLCHCPAHGDHWYLSLVAVWSASKNGLRTPYGPTFAIFPPLHSSEETS
jgi:hypothetical protein